MKLVNWMGRLLDRASNDLREGEVAGEVRMHDLEEMLGVPQVLEAVRP